jgi:undecaprenyl-diphosphatase
MLDILGNIDQQIFFLINGWNSPVFDEIMYYVSGKFTWSPLYLLFLILLFRKYPKKWWQLLVFIVFLVVMSDQTSVQLFKNVFQRLRPCQDPSLEGLVHLVRDRCGGQFSFISSHATNTSAAGAFVWVMMQHRPRWLLPIIVFWVLLVGYSRIYLGVHYPFDVLAGFAWGTFIGWLVGRFALRVLNSEF